MANEYSFEALMQFLDYLAEKGIMKKTAVFSKKAACNKMLSILDASERNDLRKIDLDDVATRFNNLQGMSYTSKTLRVYKSRTSNALNDFIRYKDNPANFSLNTKPKNLIIIKKKGRAQIFPATIDRTVQSEVTPITSTNTINIPVSLRPNCIIQMNGIPTDMTNLEAKKIANVILAMATIEE